MDMQHHLFGGIRFHADPGPYFDGVVDGAGALSSATTNDRAHAREALERCGAALYEALVPDALRSRLWPRRADIRTLVVQSRESWIPWELLRMHGHEGERIEELPPLCEGFEMTRWIPDRAFKSSVGRFQRIALVTCEHPSAAHGRERAFMLSLAGNDRVVDEIRPSLVEVTGALKSGRYDAWHFIGHGLRLDNAGPAVLQLSAGEHLASDQISGVVANLGEASPLVVLNACHGGRLTPSLTDRIGGFPIAFVRAGACAFLGPMWEVDDEAALELTRTFYRRLLAGETFGSAVRAARVAAGGVDPVAGLAYTAFADPAARVR